jgi:hypothetical protein
LVQALVKTSEAFRGGVGIGLKRKYSLSYFRENFEKINFRFSQKKLTKSYENKLGVGIGLKRKYSLSYFRENFEKINFRGNGKYCEIS